MKDFQLRSSAFVNKLPATYHSTFDEMVENDVIQFLLKLQVGHEFKPVKYDIAPYKQVMERWLRDNHSRLVNGKLEMGWVVALTLDLHL
ncbi:hypothetical protein ACOSQ3_006339 [Xanthoceras sorbifolium]